jgi:uncharacterized membrane protein YeaQ/YmgE (transglycosylase-associated protein family)
LTFLKRAGAEPFPHFSSQVLGRGENVQIAIWIFVGLAAGWLAGKSLEGNGYGVWMDLVMGVAGAIVGGFLARSIGFPGYGGVFVSTFMAIGCAALLTVLVALVNGRTVRARAF